MTQDAIWTELSLRVAQNATEDVADLLQQATGSGVTIEPPIEALGPDEGYILDTEAPYTLRAYLYGAVSPEQRQALQDQVRNAGFESVITGDFVWSTLREEDWAEAWKEHYQVEHVGRVAIRPAWREYEAAPGEVVVSLDPGMAFGTGQHPTTRMCMQALQDRMKPGDVVLDLGCGSGVLAFAAVYLGAAGDVICIDTEEQAVAATISNAALNGQSDRIVARLGSIDQVLDDGPFDFVLANINAATVTALAKGFAAHMKSGAYVAAGGIVAERQEAPLAAMRDAGLEVIEELSDGDWRTFVCRKT
jgi:ribosomal protein L11 methyltransferase